METKEVIAQAQAIAQAAKQGVVSYEEARVKITPLLEVVNKRGREIAKKYKMQYKPITFTGLIR